MSTLTFGLRSMREFRTVIKPCYISLRESSDSNVYALNIDLLNISKYAYIRQVKNTFTLLQRNYKCEEKCLRDHFLV